MMGAAKSAGSKARDAKGPEKKPRLQDEFLARLTPAARAAIARRGAAAGADPVNPDVDRLRARLSGPARRAVGELAGAQAPPEADPGKPRYGLVEAPDGEWATLRIFPTAEALARRLAALEGRDVVAVAFHGVPVPFTAGPQRYLMLPDGATALQVPSYQGGLVRRVPRDLLADTVELAEDGYLGPPELANARGRADASGSADDADPA